MSTPDATSRLVTARNLLSGPLTGVDVMDVPPDPELAELDAVDGFGVVLVDHDLRVSVYLLDAWGRGHDHEVALQAWAEASQRLAGIAVNGDLLFFGTLAAAAQSMDQYLLNDLCAAFAGRE